MPTGSFFAYVMLWLWVPVSLIAYAFLRPRTAYLVSLVGGTMLLPEKIVVFKLPAIPGFEKPKWLAVLSLLGLALFHRRVLARFRFGPLEVLIALALVFGLVTNFTNLEPVVRGIVRVDGHSMSDAINITLEYLLVYGIPVILARLIFRSSEDLKVLLAGLAILSALYAVPFLWEIRMSPQLHRDWYGFMQHDFQQTRRGDGYRPMVFMAHGLAVAVLNMVSFLAGVILWKTGRRIGRFSARWFALLSGGLLAIGRSLGALLFGLVGTALILFFRPKAQATVAASIGVFVIVYPLLRMADVVPTTEIVTWIAENISEDRAGSLGFRFENEVMLAARAAEKPLFGWGFYCRSCVRDPTTGEQVSVADGEWIIAYGERGLLGFFAMFGTLVLPLFAVWRRIGQVPDRLDRRLLAGLSVIVALSVFDLVPNSLFAPALTMSLIGALYSFSQTLPDPRLASGDDQPFAKLATIIGRIRAAADLRAA